MTTTQERYVVRLGTELEEWYPKEFSTPEEASQWAKDTLDDLKEWQWYEGDVYLGRVTPHGAFITVNTNITPENDVTLYLTPPDEDSTDWDVKYCDEYLAPEEFLEEFITLHDVLIEVIEVEVVSNLTHQWAKEEAVPFRWDTLPSESLEGGF